MPALARRKTLPQSYWTYGDLTDPRVKEIFLRREILRDLDDDAPPEVRRNAEMAFVEAASQYVGFIDLATLPETRSGDDPWQRVTEIARRIPLWNQPRPDWPAALFDATKAIALREAVLSSDAPTRTEVKGSRLMYHLTADGLATKPLRDVPPCDVRSHIQGEMLRLLRALTEYEPEDEARKAREADTTVVSLERLLAVRVPEGKFRRLPGWSPSLSDKPEIERLMRAPNGRDHTAGDDAEASRRHVSDLIGVATPGQREFIEARVQWHLDSALTRGRRTNFTLEEWAKAHPTDENRWALKAARSAELAQEVKRELRLVTVRTAVRSRLTAVADKLMPDFTPTDEPMPDRLNTGVVSNQWMLVPVNPVADAERQRRVWEEWRRTDDCRRGRDAAESEREAARITALVRRLRDRASALPWVVAMNTRPAISSPWRRHWSQHSRECLLCGGFGFLTHLGRHHPCKDALH